MLKLKGFDRFTENYSEEAKNRTTAKIINIRRKERWVQEAAAKIAEADKIKNMNKASRVRNRLINRAYAEMYLNDPQAFKWAGLAGFASRSAGSKLGLLREGSCLGVPAFSVSPMLAMVLWLSAASCDYLYDRVSRGNRAIYEDIYWQHLAYRAGGIEELTKICEQGDLPEELLAAWKLVDQGKKTGDIELIWQGNTALLEYEQREIIQPILYEGGVNRPLWKLISLVDKFVGLLITSPVPEEEQLFRDHLPKGDLGDFQDRWNWCTESIFPGWRSFEAENPDKVKTLLAKL
jgi:hypothetical protein